MYEKSIKSERLDRETQVDSMVSELRNNNIEIQKMILVGDSTIGVMEPEERLEDYVKQDLESGVGMFSMGISVLMNLGKGGALTEEFLKSAEGHVSKTEMELFRKLNEYGSETLRLEAEARVNLGKLDTLRCISNASPKAIEAQKVLLKKQRDKQLNSEEAKQVSVLELADQILNGKDRKNEKVRLTENEEVILTAMAEAFDERLALQAEISLAKK